MERAESRGRGLMTAAAVAGFFVILGQATRVDMGPAGASAQPATPQSKVETPFNSAEQRKQQLDEMRSINARLGNIEALLRKGLEVKVTSMPAAAGDGEEKK